jgi:hypothetical protein
MIDRVICGWRVRSMLPLPETAPWRGPDRSIDIEIRQGAVPAGLSERTADLPYIEVAANGSLVVDSMPVARFLVTADRIVVDAARAEAPEWRAYLLGPVLGVVCYLRGVLPLHASALRVGNRTVAFAGRSGAGKSTLATALTCRGHTLVTDDICACTGLPGRPLVLPTYPAVKLSRASLDMLGIESRDLTSLGPDADGEKFQLLRRDGFDLTPPPLDVVYMIEDAPKDEDDAIVQTGGAEAFERLSAEIYRPPIGRLLLARPAFFAMATQLAAQVAVRRLVRRPDPARLAALTEMIESDVAKS